MGDEVDEEGEVDGDVSRACERVVACEAMHHIIHEEHTHTHTHAHTCMCMPMYMPCVRARWLGGSVSPPPGVDKQ